MPQQYNHISPIVRVPLKDSCHPFLSILGERTRQQLPDELTDGFAIFMAAIAAMNRMYKLPVNTRPSFHLPTIHGVESPLERLEKFVSTLQEEIAEYDQVAAAIKKAQTTRDENDKDLALVALVDWFADILVYTFSEAIKFGLPIVEALFTVMESNFTKLPPDGIPVYDNNGKFLKGPNFIPPEKLLKALLAKL